MIHNKSLRKGKTNQHSSKSAPGVPPKLRRRHTTHGTATEQTAVPPRSHGRKGLSVKRKDFVGRTKFFQRHRWLGRCELARIPAHVAPVDAPVKIRAGRQVSTALNCQIGQTAPGVKSPVGSQRPGRTRTHTRTATVTLGRHGAVRRQLKSGEYLSEKKSRSGTGHVKLSVQPHIAYPGPHSPIPLGQRRRIAAHTGKRPVARRYEPRHPAKTLAHHHVIVATQRIIGQQCVTVVRRRGVGKRSHYHGAHTRQHIGRIAAQRGMACEVIHRAVTPPGYPPVIPGCTRVRHRRRHGKTVAEDPTGGKLAANRRLTTWG